MKRISYCLVLLLSVCALSVECAESVATTKTQPSLSDASEAGLVAGNEAFLRGLNASNVRTISRAMALSMVCNRDHDPYVETLNDALFSSAFELMPKPQLDEYAAISLAHNKAYYVAYYLAFNKVNFGYAIGYSESYLAKIEMEKNPAKKAALKSAACVVSDKITKDVFFEMNQKPKQKH